ncbi:hypothetical protein GCM10023350_24850 [Nocardioides endophyticus]|uniref:Enoyl reductase (ER) domain-containing protein n=1 Tax=Nocardioides endophyticus TaxID=1353775 RepID=A0ABP8YV90_9ACTN
MLSIEEAPEPRPLPTEVTVRVKAIGLNPLEALMRAGVFPLLGKPPFVLGWDISGVVEVAQTWRFMPGDEVFGMPNFPRAANAYAEVVSAPALHLVRKPSVRSHVEAAALPTVGLTAWQGLVDLGGVSEGDRVLVHGADGGVGHFAIQIAKAFGAQVVATASASKRESDRSRSSFRGPRRGNSGQSRRHSRAGYGPRRPPSSRCRRSQASPSRWPGGTVQPVPPR